MSAEPKPGDLLLVHAPTLYEDAIEIAERISLLRQGIRSPLGHPIYGHVAVYVGGGQVIEALGRGLVCSPVTKYVGHSDIWTQDVSSAARDRVVMRALSMFHSGYRYSWVLIAILAVRLLFGLRLPWHQKGSLVCSVFGYDCWLADHIEIAKTRACAPEDIPLGGQLYFGGAYTG